MERFFPRFRQQPEIEQGSGSGFVVSADGYILTNNHVVEGAEQVTVRLLDRREFKAKVVGHRPATPTWRCSRSTPRACPPCALGNSDDARVGEWVLAIGNPLGEGLTFTVTSGIVSAKGRALNGLPRAGPGEHPGLHPDRRRHQPGQLGRPAGERPGRGHRHQLRHRQRDRVLLRLRLRDPDQPRPHGDEPAHRVGQGAPRGARRIHRRRLARRRRVRRSAGDPGRRGEGHPQRRLAGQGGRASRRATSSWRWTGSRSSTSASSSR